MPLCFLFCSHLLSIHNSTLPASVSHKNPPVNQGQKPCTSFFILRHNLKVLTAQKCSLFFKEGKSYIYKYSSLNCGGSVEMVFNTGTSAIYCQEDRKDKEDRLFHRGGLDSMFL